MVKLKNVIMYFFHSLIIFHGFISPFILSIFHIKYNTPPPVVFLHQIVLRMLLSHHQANRKYLLFGISDGAITAHGIDCVVTSLFVTWAVSLVERCHSLGERCHFLSKPGSLSRSQLRTTDGFGFRASASRRAMP